jgi:hypothetical protein
MWHDKCMALATNTTRAVTVVGCAAQPAPNAATQCRGGDHIAVAAFGFGCTLSSPRPNISVGGVPCSDVRAPPSPPDRGCAVLTTPQVLMCTLPSVGSLAQDTPLEVLVEWPHNTTVKYLNDFAAASPANVSIAATERALSVATVTYSCATRSCAPAAPPQITYLEGCRGDMTTGGVFGGSITDVSATSFLINRRARGCAREGGTLITVHGLFLDGDLTITVGGLPCRDAQHDFSTPGEGVTCELPCPAGNRTEWIPDLLRRAYVDEEHRVASSWDPTCVYGGVHDGVVGNHQFSQIDGVAQDGTSHFSGWCAAANGGDEFLELDLGSVQRIAGVVTQGRADQPQWVTGFDLHVAGRDRVFAFVEKFSSVNADKRSHVNSTFALGQYGQFVRIYPWNTFSGGNPALRADILLGHTAGGYMGSSNAQHVVACTQHGCSPTAENTLLTYAAAYSAATTHLCFHAPTITNATRSNTTLVLRGSGFGAGPPDPVEQKRSLRFRYGADTDALCDLAEPGRVAAWSQTAMDIALDVASSDAGCTAMLAALHAAQVRDDELVMVMYTGSKAGCFPPNAPCIRAIRGCAMNVSGDAASTAACFVEGGVELTITGRNLNATLVRLGSDALAAAAALGDAAAALEIVSFTPGTPTPVSPFSARARSDELRAVLPCLFPNGLWGGQFSLVSGGASASADQARSLPTLRYKNDYDAALPYLCYRAPVVEAIGSTVASTVAQQGDVLELRGHHFGAYAPSASAAKLWLSRECYVTVGALDPCRAFEVASWSATVLRFTLCNGAGFDLPLVLALGLRNSSQSTRGVSVSYVVAAPPAEQPTLASIKLRRPGVVDIVVRAPLNTFDTHTHSRPWRPLQYMVEWSNAGVSLPAQCASALFRASFAASNVSAPAELPTINATIADPVRLQPGNAVQLRLAVLKRDGKVNKWLCTLPMAFDVALPPMPPRNVSVTLGAIDSLTKRASFLVFFRPSVDFGGRPATACSFEIHFLATSGNMSGAIGSKTVPALSKPSQVELIDGMLANTGYDVWLTARCAALPAAQGVGGVLSSGESSRYAFRVEPHREYALQCAKTGDFSTLIDVECIPCPTEAEGGQCFLGLLGIRPGYWMPSVTLARAIETRKAKRILFWACRNTAACVTIPAIIDDGPGASAVPRSTCAVGFEGNVCNACVEGFGPLGTGCIVCPPDEVSLLMSSGVLLYVLATIGGQTYNTYRDAKERMLAGAGNSGSAVVVKILIDYFQLVGGLAFISIEPPQAVRRLFSVFALGNGVSANAFPIQCLFKWNVYGRTFFYMFMALASIFGPSLFAAIYWFARWLRSRAPQWKADLAACLARHRAASATAPVGAPPGLDEGGGEEAMAPVEADLRVAAPRRRRSSVVVALTEAIAQGDHDENALLGPVASRLLEQFHRIDSDGDGCIDRAQFEALVAEAAPTAAFIDKTWRRIASENGAETALTIDFEQFALVVRTIEVRRTMVIVVTTTVVSVFFNYMRVSTALVEVFMPSDPFDGRRYLSADLDAPAYSEEHIATMFCAGLVLVVFTVGAPLSALIVMTHFFRTNRLVEPEIFTMFGFLYAGYKPHFFWWEVIVLARKVAATVIALAPIAVELKALSAAALLLVIVVLQLIVRPYNDERHNTLDCFATSSIVLKQICAVAFHHVRATAVDTVDSQQRVAAVEWIISPLVIGTSTVVMCLFVGLFVKLKVEEWNGTREMAVAAAQRLWVEKLPPPPSMVQRVLNFVKRVVARRAPATAEVDAAVDTLVAEEAGVAAAEGGAAGNTDATEDIGTEDTDDSAAEQRLRLFVGNLQETFELDVAARTAAIAGLVLQVEEAKRAARREAERLSSTRTLQYIEGEEIDERGWIQVTIVPTQLCDFVAAKLCPCCWRARHLARVNVLTNEIQYGQADALNKRADAAATGGIAEDTLNPLAVHLSPQPDGIALNALAGTGRIPNVGRGIRIRATLAEDAEDGGGCGAEPESSSFDTDAEFAL